MPVTVQCPNPDCHFSFSIALADASRARRCPQCGWDLDADPESSHSSTLTPDPNQPSALDEDRPPPRSAPDPLVGETIAGRYTIVRVLGKGGMGAVYLATDNRLGGRKVAVKVPKLDEEHDAAFLKRLEREAQIAAQFQHPNICPIYDVGTDHGRPFLVLAYIEGTSLAEHLDRRKKPFDVVQAVKLVAVVAQALDEAHKTGILHRDLKPDNIMLTREGRPIVMDFGLAKRTDSGEKLTSAGKAFGTPAYMPIEQYRDVAAIDHRADIYSLGVTLYQLLTGQLPYRGSLYQILGALQTTAPTPPSALRPEVDRDLESICLNAMAKEAGERYDSMRAFAEALDLWLKRTESPPPKPPPPGPPPPLGRGRGAGKRTVVALGVLGLMVLLGIVANVATDHGTVRITVDDPEATIRVDGATIRIEKVGEPIELTLRPGTHELLATRGNLVFQTREFTLTRGGRETIRVTYVPPPDQTKTQHREPPPTPSRAVAVAKTEKPPVAPPEPTPQPEEARPAPPEPVAAVNKTSKPSEPKAQGFAESIGITIVPIPEGEFWMGSPDSDKDAKDDEKPRHKVRIRKLQGLSAHEVTVGQFRKFVEDTGYKTEGERDGTGGYGIDAKGAFKKDPRLTWRDPGFPQSDDHPVVLVSWNDAKAFCDWLSRKDGRTYRLPTEAEWEYCCRAGTETRFCNGDDPEKLARVGNVADARAKARFPNWTRGIAADDGFVFTAPVGHYEPNAWGLYDMHGNVWEWCLDSYDAKFYDQPPAPDPLCSAGASARVDRGGSWIFYPQVARSADRGRRAPGVRNINLGFRLARDQSGSGE
jgi:formylglycine-generating enzyme required for sulfatase activity/serine/threonine protein kinase